MNTYEIIKEVNPQCYNLTNAGLLIALISLNVSFWSESYIKAILAATGIILGISSLIYQIITLCKAGYKSQIWGRATLLVILSILTAIILWLILF